MSGFAPFYHCGSDRSERLDASYVMILGDNTFAPGPRGRTNDEFIHGTSNTIAIAEMSESRVPWMAPRDLLFDRMSFHVNDSKLDGIRSKHPGGAIVGLADGSARYISNDIDAEVLKRVVQISGQNLRLPN